jgi:hypothetical protein
MKKNQPNYRLKPKYLLFVFIFLSFTVRLTAQIIFDPGKEELKIKYNNVLRLTGGKGYTEAGTVIKVNTLVNNNVALLNLTPSGTIGPDQYAGIFFNDIPQLKQGITIWRYKPWNSWTKPIAITSTTQMPDWDVQFFYWQYKDGLYGAAIPLSGNGFRTTLGNRDNQWGSKAISYAENNNIKEVPAMALAFGKDPFELFSRIYRIALESMGKGDNIYSKKKMPEALKYIGWCTWNASEMGKNLNEKYITNAVKTFTDKKFPLGWILVDDGWFQHKDGQLLSLQPDTVKFPNGFRPLIKKLKGQFHIKYVGIWHAFNGYWNGIDPDSKLGAQYKKELFSWKQKEKVHIDTSAIKTYYFLNPRSNGIHQFYESWHQYLKNQGFDFVKVDNQLVPEKMAVDNFPIFDLSEKMHEALYKSINKYFNGAVINCMDMTADAYLNFGSSAVARSVEDYFPYEKGETYNLQKGNAAAHVLQAIYNAIYFSQMVYPDFDMFQSHHPNAILHAVARTINNGPIYLTDNPGEQNFDILNKIVFADGKSIRSETALLPAEDCLFQVQEPALFKAYSKVRTTGLLALMNLADADRIQGKFRPADVHGIKGDAFAIYECFSEKLRLANRDDSFEVVLPRMGYQLEYVVPVKNGFAAFGLTNKYNAPATIIAESYAKNKATISLYEGGTFNAYCKERPGKIVIAGKEQSFSYRDHVITVEIGSSLKKPVLVITW